MAHNIKDNKAFYSLRKSAWHQLRQPSQTEMRASEAADTLLPYRWCSKELPLALKGNTSYYDISEFKALVTVDHKPDGFEVHTHGVVSKQYRTVRHENIIALYDAVIGAPVETMGLLGKGEILFVTTKLPAFDVAGDEIVPYLAILNPLTGKDAIKALTPTTRIVCQNTMNLALGESVEQSVAVSHRSNPLDRLHDWLSQVWQSRLEAIALLKETGELLAHRSLTEPIATSVLNTIYPLPIAPDVVATEAVRAKYEEEALKQTRHQLGVKELLQTANNLTPATRGTRFGLYSAIVEYEDHARKYASARSKVLGEGARRKDQALSLLLNV